MFTNSLKKNSRTKGGGLLNKFLVNRNSCQKREKTTTEERLEVKKNCKNTTKPLKKTESSSFMLEHGLDQVFNFHLRRVVHNKS